MRVSKHAATGNSGDEASSRSTMANAVKSARALSLHHSSTDGPERREIKAFLDEIYASKYGATLSSHYPNFLYGRGENGEILAAIGFRFLRDHEAFLQQYLDEPVETAVARALGKPVARMQIVEMGSFASTGVNVVGLFAELALHLHASGASYAVATSTSRLLRCFQLLGIETQSIAPANPNRLKDGGVSWGTYYGTNPEVIAGDIAATCSRLAAYVPAANSLAQQAGTAA